MPVENGVATTNGTGVTPRSGSDDFDDVSSVAVRVDVIDETGNDVSLNASREAGLDNPAFSGGEEEEEQEAAGIISATNGGTRNHPSAEAVVSGNISATNGHQTHHQHQSNGGKGDNMEMAPLNPNAAPHTAAAHNNKKAAKNGSANTVAVAANATTNGAKDQSKTALDNICNNDYFRPVNTKRKLLRGEKLYVMSDQRAQSRGWKWIAFWGGVFTFVAAALLAGILAATGVIMSKSEPSLSASNSLIASNLSDVNANDTMFQENDVTGQHTDHTGHVTQHWNNDTGDTMPEPSMPQDDHQHIHHGSDPASTSTSGSLADDLTNNLDQHTPSILHQNPDQHSTVQQQQQHHHSDNQPDQQHHLFLATADHNATLDAEHSPATAAPPSGMFLPSSTPLAERARSLDNKEVAFVPAENATLFPVMRDFDSSDDDWMAGQTNNVTASVNATASDNSTAATSFESEMEPIGWSASTVGAQSDGDNSSDTFGIINATNSSNNVTEMDEHLNGTAGQPTINQVILVNDTLANGMFENETVTIAPTNPISPLVTHSTIPLTNETTVASVSTNDTAETMTSSQVVSDPTPTTNGTTVEITPLHVTRANGHSEDSNASSPEVTNATPQAVLNVTGSPRDLAETVEDNENSTITTSVHHNSTGNRTGKSDDGTTRSSVDFANNSATLSSTQSSSPFHGGVTSGLPVHIENSTSDDAMDMTRIVDFAITTIVTTIHEEDVPVPLNNSFPVPLNNTSLPHADSTPLPLNETRA